MKYVIITPVRDEQEYIEKTVQSVQSQTIRPVEWVIVDDGSSDRTGEIIDSYAKECAWISAVHRKNRGYRQAGEGVVNAFYEGYRALRSCDVDFIVKLDGDLSFEPDYFERCFENFERDPGLGVSGGCIFNVSGDNVELEEDPVFHVRGATKIYRKKCWDDIGGLLAAPGWDTLDELKANMLGWKTKGFRDLRVMHYRYTGMAAGHWRNWVKNGLANYISGYHPLFMFLKSVKRLTEKPHGLASLGLFYGFLSGYVKRVPQVEDKDLIRYVRREQLKRLFFRSSIYAPR